MGKLLKRILLACALLALLLVGLPVAAGVGVVALAYGTGTVTVDVDDGRGTDFTLPVPAGLVPMALRFLPDEVCRELQQEVAPSWGAVRGAVDELHAIPDAVLVEVDSGPDRVRVVKRGGRIEVQVRSAHEHVNVAVPLHLVSSVVHQVERACF